MSDLATGVWLFPEAPAPDLVSFIVEAETLGIDEVWLGDEGPAREPFAVLAAAAVKTMRIRLGVGITNPYVRTPGLATTSMLTVHELSNGRAVLGVGAGGQMSLAPFGLRAERPAQRVREFLEIARAVSERRTTSAYVPPDSAIDAAAAGAPLPLFVGGRGPRLNTLASEHADGAFVAGLPPHRYEEVIGWARSTNPIQIALYPSVAFDDAGIEHHRPEMIWSLIDAPAQTRRALGLVDGDIAHAAEALRAGRAGPARRLITDDILGQLMLVGSPATIGVRLAELVSTHKPSSIGLALLQPDLSGGLQQVSEAFAAMHELLEEAP